MEPILPLETLQMLVSEAYANLYSASDAAFQAAQDRRAADEVLSDTRDRIISETDPKTLGSNEEQRKAGVNVLSWSERDNQRKAMEAEAAAVHSLRIAERRVEEARAYLTIARIAAALPERSH